MIGLPGLDTIVMPPFVVQQPTSVISSNPNSSQEDHQRRASASIWVEGAIIVGAGPSGLAVAACLKDRGIPSIVLDKSDCIASLWQHRTYDRLHLHIAKQYCQLPLLPFADDVPLYPSKHEFLQYLHDYADHFNIQPTFDRCVVSAAFERGGFWRVQTADKSNALREEFLGRWLVVATGENATERIPDDLHGLDSFRGSVLHSSEYRNGKSFANKRVLVVGSGNSGMEIALDLVNYDAMPSLIVRSPMHILPKEMFGRSTFGMAMKMMKLLPLSLTDRLLVLYASLVLGNTSKYGISRPRMGPLERKAKLGKTPILDMGAFEQIRTGSIKVLPAVDKITIEGARFVNGQEQSYDVIILATGYKSNVPFWLKDDDENFSTDGFPKTKSWKFGKSLYVAGLSKQGILGAANDAKSIAEDISNAYNFEQKQFLSSILKHS